MGGFNAGALVEALDFDFNPYVDAKGTITEPTDGQIATFLNDLQATVERIKHRLPDGVDTDDPAEVIAAIDGLDASAITETHQELASVFAALCSGNPSRELLLRVPMRVRSIFYGWLQQEVMSPEAVPGAGNAQVTTLRRAAAG